MANSNRCDFDSTSNHQSDLLIALASEPNTGKLLARIVKEAQSITNADGGTLYLLKEYNDQPCLEFAMMNNTSLGTTLGGAGEKINLPPIPLYLADGKENHHHVAAYSALKKEAVSIDDAYQSQGFDFSGTKIFDQNNGYRSTSFLTVPLLNHNEDVIGVLQLINSQQPQSLKVQPFPEDSKALILALAKYAAIALNNSLLISELKNLLDAFIKVIAAAIDAKSPHTSGHCQRVPLITELIAQAACEDDQTFADFNFDDDQWYELKVAAWMHDCGKLATPDSVLDKSTKLHALHDRIHEVETRFAAARQHLIANYWHARSSLSHADDTHVKHLEEQHQQDLAALEDDLSFIRTANKGGEFMAEDKKQRVQQIAKRTWPDHQGELQPMLNEDEIYNLCIERGTLTNEERQIINNHMKVTIDMLESLPFPRKLKRVPEYAGGHHERMDGKGFPRGLTGEQLSIPARMMAIADIFEALTAKDRPYKDPMKISLSLKILKDMSQTGHIDPDLFNLFVRKRVWEQYAKQVLAPEQLDITDASEYLV
ncbi:MAG: HD domain-containing phosphohydrolase [Venatoribacter sp.]